jgi:transforming growth factor-beta-induced protein
MAAFAATLLLLVACSGHKEQGASTTTTIKAKPPASASHTVLDYINGDSDLSTLASLVRGTAFEKTLQGPGPITLFAPTNEALTNLPAGTQAQLSSPDSLANLLNRHLVRKKLTAADLIPLAGTTIETVSGPVQVSIDGRTLQIGSVPVTRTDILASNGVVHLVGGVVVSAS